MELDIEKLLAISTALPDPVFILTESGHYAGLFGGGDRSYYHDGSGLVGASLYSVLPKEKADWFMAQIKLSITEDRMLTVEYGLSGADVEGIDSADGPSGEIWFEGRIQPLSFTVDGKRAVVWVARNITLRHQLEHQLRLMSERDELTGIFNRRRLFCELEKKYAEFCRYGTRSSLLMFDIDYFKAVNDRYGHVTGDTVLRVMAQQCEGLFRELDLFARFGGEEFAVLLPSTDMDAAVKLADRVRAEVESLEFVHEEQPFNITISVGIDSFRQGDASHEDVVKRTDDQLYSAKEEGRNRIAYSSV